MSAHLIPHPNAPLPLEPVEIVWARKRLILGDGLAQIAEELGVEPFDVDHALWKRVIRHGQRQDRSAA